MMPPRSTPTSSGETTPLCTTSTMLTTSSTPLTLLFGMTILLDYNAKFYFFYGLNTSNNFVLKMPL